MCVLIWFCLSWIVLLLCQWCTFFSSSVIGQLKSPKTDWSNPHQDVGASKIQFWWSHVPLLLWCRRQACRSFPTKFKPQISEEHWHVDESTQTVETPCCGWSKRLCIYSASCFEPKVTSWSEIWRLFQDGCELQVFLFCSQPQILFSASLMSCCFCIVWTPCPIKDWSPGHFGSKNGQHYYVLK